jgi:ABC-type sugar transport system permease subunit
MTRREWWVPYAFLAPALLGLLVFKLVPIGYALKQSVYGATFAFGASVSFVGLTQYQQLFSDPTFSHALLVTVIFNAIINPLQTALALALALLVNRRFRGIGFFRSLYFIPVGISLAVASVVWGILLDPELGLVNSVLRSIGLPGQPFLTSPAQALGSIILIASWIGVPYWMIFFLAGLQDIPRTLYESASIDGAGRWQAFWRITLPLLRRTTTFVLVADTAANFLLFVPVYVLTQGGPTGSTDLLMYEVYRAGFIASDMGRAAALTVILLLATLVVVFLELMLGGSTVSE